jgi:hypothetical protein
MLASCKAMLSCLENSQAALSRFSQGQFPLAFSSQNIPAGQGRKQLIRTFPKQQFVLNFSIFGLVSPPKI